MIYTILIILVLLILMTTIVFLIVKKTIENVNNQGKVYFTLRIQDYELNKEKLEKEKEEEKVKKEEIEENNIKNNNIIYVEKMNNYEIDNIFKLTKMVDEKFSINCRKILLDFIDKNVDNNGNDRYLNLKRIKDELAKRNVYKIITSNEMDVEKTINDIDKNILNEYLVYNDKFNFEEFVNYIDAEISKVDPTIYVYVGDKNLNFDSIDKRIKVIYNKNIYKGMQIIYHNKVYDYSLS